MVESVDRLKSLGKKWLLTGCQVGCCHRFREGVEMIEEKKRAVNRFIEAVQSRPRRLPGLPAPGQGHAGRRALVEASGRIHGPGGKTPGRPTVPAMQIEDELDEYLEGLRRGCRKVKTMIERRKGKAE